MEDILDEILKSKNLIKHLHIAGASSIDGEGESLDKMNKISSNEFKPFVIVRVMVGAKKPIDAGLQHTQDYSK